MPHDWQEKFIALMAEAEELLPEEAHGGDYWVRLREGNRFVSDPNVPYKHAQPWSLRVKP